MKLQEVIQNKDRFFISLQLCDYKSHYFPPVESSAMSDYIHTVLNLLKLNSLP